MHCNLRPPEPRQSFPALMTGSGIFFYKVWPMTTYPCRNYSVFDANTLCHAMTLTFDPVALKVRDTSSVTWSKSIRNFNEIEQSRLNYRKYCEFLHTLCHAVSLIFDLLALNFYGISCVMLLNFIQNLSEIAWSTAELLTF